MPINYSQRTRAQGGQRIAEDVAQRLRYPITGPGYGAQLAAAMSHAADPAAIAAPTLVVHGEEDVLIPPENGRRLASLVPGAELRMFAETAHLYPTDEPETDLAIRDFLSAPTIPGRTPPDSR